MKEVEIQLNGKTCFFNDVPGSQKSVVFSYSSTCYVFYYFKEFTYRFVCHNDCIEFSKSHHDENVYCGGTECDVTEEEAFKFISIN